MARFCINRLTLVLANKMIALKGESRTYILHEDEHTP